MKARLLWGVRLAVTVGLLYAVFARIHFAEVWSMLAAARPGYVIGSLGLLLVVRMAAAARMKILTDAQDLSLTIRELFEISTIATFYGLALPGTLAGGAIRWQRLSRRHGGAARGLAAIMFDRLIDTLMLVLCGMAFWVLDRHAAVRAAAGPVLLAVLGGLLAVLALVFDRRFSGAFWHVVTTRLPVPRMVRSALRSLQEASARYHELSARSLSLLVGLSITRQVIGIGSSYLFALALGLPLTFSSVGWIRSCFMLLAMLPITLSGLGVREVSSVAILGAYGVPPAQAVAWSLLLFTKILLGAAIGGFVELRDLLLPRRTAGRVPSAIVPAAGSAAVDD